MPACENAMHEARTAKHDGCEGHWRPRTLSQMPVPQGEGTCAVPDEWNERPCALRSVVADTVTASPPGFMPQDRGLPRADKA